MLDMREGPGHQMKALAVRVPADLIEALDCRAAKLRTPRAVLCRNLLASGLERLESSYAAWGELEGS